jgi:hypothetical protein
MKVAMSPSSFASELDHVIPLDSIGKRNCFDPTVGSPINARPTIGSRTLRQATIAMTALDLPFRGCTSDTLLMRDLGDFTSVKDDYDCSTCRRVNHTQARRSIGAEASRGIVPARNS